MKALIVELSVLLSAGSATADLQSTFDRDTEAWSATPGATASWVDVDSNGYAQASFTNSSPWYFEAPASWLGDWSGYRQLKWDLIIASGGYADSNATDIVVIEGANGTNLVWRGPTPYWEWSHYEVPLEPLYFGVDQDAFDGVMQNVAAFKILGEYRSGTETVGLDNVLATTNSATVYTTLSSTFDSGMEDWRPYDDVTLSHMPTNGNPGGYLHGVDWADGRSYRFASPFDWAGDWRAFTTLDFDLTIVQGSTGLTGDTLWIRGGNGQTLIWDGPDPEVGKWNRYRVYLTPSTFGVDQAAFDAVMAHVTEILILGEYRSGSEQEGLDNVVLSSAPIDVITSNLLSTFDADLEGWSADGDGRLEWTETGGNPGGYCLGIDGATGPLWHFVTPEAWTGNWINLTWLQFKMKSVTGATWSERPLICLTGMNGIELWATNTVPDDSWTPYGLALTPERFGTDTATFNSVITYVKHLRIYGEVGSGVDRAALDTFGLYTERPSPTWPERSSTFDTDAEDWRNLNGITLSWQAEGGQPDGYLRGDNDGSGIWHYVSPESWNGDWTGYQSLRFDHIILYGFNAGWANPTFYIVGANNQTLEWKGPEASNSWVRFEVNLSPDLFGVDQATYDAVMERVVEVCIRGEYVNGSESEGLDNVHLSSVPISTLSAPSLAIGYDGTNTFVLFQTETNATYQLQACTNLVEGTGWEPVTGAPLPGDGNLGEIEFDPTRPAGYLRLYVY